MILRFEEGRYASQVGRTPNGTEVFTISWPTVRGAGLSISSSLPGIQRKDTESTNYADARELCARLLESWLRRVFGINRQVTVKLGGDE